MAIIKSIFRTLAGILKKKNLYLAKSLAYTDMPKKLPVALDHVRSSALELCQQEIEEQNISGNLAELGVYKGDFAWRLNHLFPERKLYLFDTFSGFDAQDITVDQTQGFSDGNQNFSDTGVDLVLSKMPFPKQCIVRKGFFPTTAKNVADKFCLVSIDTDLYQPILSGLQFFYPRLAHGGYIFVHDFNNQQYKGARQAVIDFCKENNLGFTPIPDIGGSVIITKPIL